MIDHADLIKSQMSESDRVEYEHMIDSLYDEYLYTRWVEEWAPLERTVQC